MKIKLLGALLLTPVVALAEWQALVSISLWYVFWLGVPIFGAAMLVAGRSKHRPAITSYGVALILSGLLGGVLAFVLNRNQVEDNKVLGDQVAMALEQHWGVHGSYPESLEQLVPDFLVELPSASAGVLGSTPFWYMGGERAGGCVLGFEAMSGIAAMRSEGRWSGVPLPW
tara:strand:- start:241849 stop:242361 length:513 start_codon:yes stop_codon:yes gene_type:complete